MSLFFKVVFVTFLDYCFLSNQKFQVTSVDAVHTRVFSFLCVLRSLEFFGRVGLNIFVRHDGLVPLVVDHVASHVAIVGRRYRSIVSNVGRCIFADGIILYCICTAWPLMALGPDCPSVLRQGIFWPGLTRTF